MVRRLLQEGRMPVEGNTRVSRWVRTLSNGMYSKRRDHDARSRKMKHTNVEPPRALRELGGSGACVADAAENRRALARAPASGRENGGR